MSTNPIQKMKKRVYIDSSSSTDTIASNITLVPGLSPILELSPLRKSSALNISHKLGGPVPHGATEIAQQEAHTGCYETSSTVTSKERSLRLS